MTVIFLENMSGHVAERCLNHKLKGVEGVYDRYDYLAERVEALNLISAKIFSCCFDDPRWLWSYGTITLAF